MWIDHRRMKRKVGKVDGKKYHALLAEPAIVQPFSTSAAKSTVLVQSSAGSCSVNMPRWFGSRADDRWARMRVGLRWLVEVVVRGPSGDGCDTSDHFDSVDREVDGEGERWYRSAIGV